MLLDKIRSLFTPGSEAPPSKDEAMADAPPARDPVAVAACVLLLELAHADGEFSASEQRHLEEVLERHFGLPHHSAQQLLVEAERERQSSVDHFSFTTQIKNSYDLGQKMVLAEVMWGLVLADGTVSDHEHYLTRKISNLLDLEPGYLSAAKQAAANKRR